MQHPTSALYYSSPSPQVMYCTPSSHPGGSASVSSSHSSPSPSSVSPMGVHMHPYPEGVSLIDGVFDADRKFTDISWFGIFMAFMSIVSIMACCALNSGNPSRLYHGINYNGLICGVDESVYDLPYLFFPLDPREEYPSIMPNDGRCLASCPTSDDVEEGKTIPVPVRNTYTQSDSSSAVTVEVKIQSPVYASVIVADAYCLPEDPSLRSQTLPAIGNGWHQFQMAVGSIASAWPVMLGYIVLAALLAMTYVILLRMSPAALLGCTAVFAIVMCIFVGGYLIGQGFSGNFTEFKGELFAVDNTWAILIGIVLFLFGLALAFALFVARKTLAMAIRVLDTAGDAIFDMPSIFVVPAIFSTAIILWIGVWLIIYMYMASSGRVDTSSYNLSLQHNGDASIIPLHREMIWDSQSILFMMFWWVALFWVFEFLLSFSHFTLAYTGTVWYFSPPEGSDDRDIGWCPPLVALSLGAVNHGGSFAIGGLVMGLTRPFRFLCSWASTKGLTPYQSDTVVYYLRECIRPIIAPVSFIVDRYTTSGYVEMSVSGHPFFPSMEKSSSKMVNSRSPAASLYGVGALGSVIGCTAISLTMGFFTYATLTGLDAYNNLSSYYFVSAPLFVSLITTIAAAFVVSQFTAVWDTIADSLLYCFLIESIKPPMVDENPMTKVHAPPALRELLLEIHEESQMSPYAFA